jgi:hypothetical protein
VKKCARSNSRAVALAFSKLKSEIKIEFVGADDESPSHGSRRMHARRPANRAPVSYSTMAAKPAAGNLWRVSDSISARHEFAALHQWLAERVAAVLREPERPAPRPRANGTSSTWQIKYEETSHFGRRCIPGKKLSRAARLGAQFFPAVYFCVAKEISGYRPAISLRL